MYAAIESNRIGWGGVRLVSQITGLTARTVAHARRQLAEQPAGVPLPPDPRLGGRPSSEVRYPGIRAALDLVLAEEEVGVVLSGESRLSRTSGDGRRLE